MNSFYKMHHMYALILLLSSLNAACWTHSPAPERAAILEKSERQDMDALLLHPSEIRLAKVYSLTAKEHHAKKPLFDYQGAHILYETYDPNIPNCPSLRLIDVDGYNDHKVSETTSFARSASFLPSSTLLMYLEGTSPCATQKTSHHMTAPGQVQLVNLSQGKRKQVLEMEHNIIAVTHSKNSEDVIITTQDDTYHSALYLIDSKGEKTKLNTHDLVAPSQASFDWSGKRIVFTASQSSEHPHQREVFIHDLQSDKTTQLTSDQALHSDPIFHPNNHTILFSSTLDSHDTAHPHAKHIFMLDTTHGLIERITFAAGSHDTPSISPDGSQLVFSSTRAPRGQVSDTARILIADFVPHPQVAQPSLKGQAAIEEQSLKSRVQRLSSSDMEGREAGSKGGEKARDYITQQFEFAGLLPHPSIKSGYLQEFSFRHPVPKATEKPQEDTTPELPADDVENINMVKADNIIGWLPARSDGQPTPHALVVGAHYDHAGFGNKILSLHDEDHGQLHPGADDNASGVAVMLELAEALQGVERSHDVIFVAFGAEEYGLHGSTHFIQSGVIPANDILAMLNFDMVGRLGSQALTLKGTESASQWRSLIRRHQRASGMNIVFAHGEGTNTDFLPFLQAHVPVAGFFTGIHDDYHRPSDTEDKIDYQGLIKITQLATLVAAELLDSTRRLQPPLKKTAPHATLK